jgi:ribosomal protein L11 methyltransferase
MADYIQITFNDITAEQSDLLLAALTEIGFEGFEEGEKNLKAFIPAVDLDEQALKEIAAMQDVQFLRTTIEETNWNAVWESNFQPIIVEDSVHGNPWAGIRAHFHEPIAGVEHEIVITPKMSFGTGHHATTFMMIQQMKDIDFNGKTVFDFGTGTGILAILAEQLGARRIVAIDHDEWSITNTAENLERNHCSKVELKKADTALLKESFDIILANINKNVILDNFSSLVKQLQPKGFLLLSGLLDTDETDIAAVAGNYSLSLLERSGKSNWIALRFTR